MNVLAALGVLIPFGMILYVIRGSLVSRQAHAQVVEKARQVQKENEALARYNRALQRNLKVSQPGVQWGSEEEFEKARQAREALRKAEINDLAASMREVLAEPETVEAMRPPVERDWIEVRSLDGTVTHIPVRPPDIPLPPMPVIQPHYDYPFPATEPPEDQ